MKRLFLLLISVITIYLSFAQEKKDCITIIETNLTKLPTVVKEIKRQKNKITILSSQNDKEYHLVLNSTNTEELLKYVDISAQISIGPKNEIMYIWIAKKEKEAIRVKLFEICK